MNKFSCLLFVALLFCSCLDKAIDKRDIKVFNKSTRVVYCLKSQSDSIKDPYINYDKVVLEKYSVIESGMSIYLDNKPRDWNTYIQNSKDGKMRVFIISKDTVEKYSWKDVLLKNKYINVYKLDVETLDKINWQLSYR